MQEKIYLETWWYSAKAYTTLVPMLLKRWTTVTVPEAAKSSRPHICCSAAVCTVRPQHSGHVWFCSTNSQIMAHHSASLQRCSPSSKRSKQRLEPVVTATGRWQKAGTALITSLCMEEAKSSHSSICSLKGIFQSLRHAEFQIQHPEKKQLQPQCYRLCFLCINEHVKTGNEAACNLNWSVSDIW